jgi:hypothetical protein
MGDFHNLQGAKRLLHPDSTSRPVGAQSDPRGTRSPTLLREAPAHPNSPTMFRSPEVVEQLLGGYRAQVLEHRAEQDRLIRRHRNGEDHMFQTALEAVRQMKGLSMSHFLENEQLPEEDVEYGTPEYVDTEDFQPTVERDSILGAQETTDTRSGLAIDRRSRPSPIWEESSPEREAIRESPGTPLPSNTGEHSITAPSLPTPDITPNQRGIKRKRAREIRLPVGVGPSSRPTLMGPPPRKAAQSAMQKTREISEFLHRGPRAQSVAIATGAHIPYVVCNCQKRSCEICGPKGKARRNET